MRIVAHATITDDDIRFTGQNRRHQFADILAFILVVGIGIDDDIGAFGQRLVDPRLESRRKSAVGPVPDNMIDTEPARGAAGIVIAAIVDDQDFDTIDAINLARQGNQRFGQACRLIIAGNLDDQLHSARIPQLAVPTERAVKTVKKPLKAYG